MGDSAAAVPQAIAAVVVRGQTICCVGKRK
jgi:hypothetical protein